MPRYFFHIREAGQVIPDQEGVELPDLAAVEFEAREGAKGLLKEALSEGRTLDHQRFEVADEAGQVVLEFPFARVLSLP